MITIKANTSLAVSAILATAAFAQGPLTPPGAPEPTMRSLAEIYDQGTAIQSGVSGIGKEPRTIITTAPFTISTSGSYLLGANLTVTSGNGITVDASDVTLDLNGFTINSNSRDGDGYGVALGNEISNVRVRNGGIHGTNTGFITGITCPSSARNVSVSDIMVRGMVSGGIALPELAGFIAERCVADSCGGSGVTASIVRSCSASNCGADAIVGDIVSDCVGLSTGPSGKGINGRMVSNSYGRSVNDAGIRGDSVTNSVGASALGIGIESDSVMNSQGNSSDGPAGISALSVMNSVGVAAGGAGIASTGSVANSYGTTNYGTYGISVSGTASHSRGRNLSGTAISADIAIGCTSEAGSVSSPSKHLGTP